MQFRTFAAVAATVIMATLPARAATITDFTFSFTNSAANGGGTVTGIVRGLEDNMTGQAATSVEILTNTAGFGIGEYVGNPFLNSWDVAGGLISGVFFSSFGTGNTSPAVVDSSFFVSFARAVQIGLNNSPTSVSSVPTGSTPQQFFKPTVVPLPATLPLLLGGLGLIGLAAHGGNELGQLSPLDADNLTRVNHLAGSDRQGHLPVMQSHRPTADTGASLAQTERRGLRASRE
ncbi:MAG: hypothetical protein AAF066_01825 [Pseudomonadota bacterium]